MELSGLMSLTSLQVLAKVAHGLQQTPVGELSDQKTSKWWGIIVDSELLKYDFGWMRLHFDKLMVRMEIVKAQEHLKLTQVKAATLEQALILAKEEVTRCATELEGHQESTNGSLHFDKVIGSSLL